MKNLKLKLTMIVTMIAILMMSIVVYATDVTAEKVPNNEGKTIIKVSVNLDDNVEEAIFDLNYKSSEYKYIESSLGEYANDMNGTIKASASASDLDDNNAVTFTFEYIGKEKEATTTFAVANMDFTDAEGNQIVVANPTIEEAVEIKIEETPAPSTETPAPSTETPAPSTETPTPSTETSAPSTETSSPASSDEDKAGEVGLDDEKPSRIPQAGTYVVPYIVGALAIFIVAGIVIVYNKRK